MSKRNTLKNLGLSLVTVFAAATAPTAVSDDNHPVNGVWENENIGTVNIQPCPERTSKFCGFLVEASPEAVEEFGLRVHDTIDSMEDIIVMSGLESGRRGDRLQNGRFENTDNGKAQRAKLSISFDGENVMNVRASIGIFGESFEFTRVPEERVTIASQTTKPHSL